MDFFEYIAEIIADIAMFFYEGIYDLIKQVIEWLLYFIETAIYFISGYVLDLVYYLIDALGFLTLIPANILQSIINSFSPEICNALVFFGIPQAMGIIMTGLLIRFVIKMIPFVG